MNMRAYFLVITVILGIFLLISPSISSSHATHNSIDNKEARKQAQGESEKINSEKSGSFVTLLCSYHPHETSIGKRINCLTSKLRII